MDHDLRTKFGRAMQSFGPEGTYTVIRLSGGLINETVRAFCHHESFILKYAPPYIAAVGPSAPFGQERQVCSLISRFDIWVMC